MAVFGREAARIGHCNARHLRTAGAERWSGSGPGRQRALRVSGAEASGGQDLFDACEVLGGELEVGCGGILGDSLWASGAGDRHDVLTAGEQPR